MSIELTSMQKQCVTKVTQWYKSASAEQIFVLAGYAGTGKSFLIRHCIAELGIDIKNVAFATFTGKAALVVTTKAAGEYKCVTLHRLLYNTEVDEKTGVIIAITPRPIEDFEALELVVVDECSMVSKEILQDLLNLKKKILFVGDNGQLPPVGAQSDIYKRLATSPDFMLTEIHRQEADNPIIHLSMLAREGKPLKVGSYAKRAVVLQQSQIGKYGKSMLGADIILCGMNKTRHSLNAQIRKAKGFSSELPMVGDKLICVKNKWGKSVGDVPLVNGLIGYAESVVNTSKHDFEMEFRPEHLKSRNDVFYSKVLKAPFNGTTVPANIVQTQYDEYEFGYAITCHKSQGSQWDNVLVISEVLRADTHARWLYTAITRAAKNLILFV